MSDERSILTRVALEAYDPQGQGSRRLCPFCGDEKPRDHAHRCLQVDFQSGLWKCFRCDRSGRLREFWQAPQSISERRILPRQRLQKTFALPVSDNLKANQSAEVAVKDKLDKFSARTRTKITRLEVGESNDFHSADTSDKEWRHHLKSWQEIRSTLGAGYLEGRGLPVSLAQNAGVGFVSNWFGRPAVLFPIRDRGGELVAVQGRAVRGDAKIALGPKSQGAFFASVPHSQGALHPLMAEVPAIILTEAPIDALSFAACGFPALAVCGTSGPNWLHIACGLRRVILALDGDKAGDKASTALQQRLQPFGAGCERLRPEGVKDWNEALQREGRAALADWLANRILID